jgi:hypothetical protein
MSGDPLLLTRALDLVSVLGSVVQAQLGLTNPASIPNVWMGSCSEASGEDAVSATEFLFSANSKSFKSSSSNLTST